MSEPTILVAGATGSIGKAMLPLLHGRVRAAVRPGSTAALPTGVERVQVNVLDRASWAAACAGVDTVISALGASVSLTLRDRAGYGAIDLVAHQALAAAAAEAGVRRALYVSVHPAPGYDQTRYVRAHMEAEAVLRAALPSVTAVRPTGVFTALHDPRLSEWVEFAVAVNTHDGIAPPVGHRTLLDYFQELAGRG